MLDMGLEHPDVRDPAVIAVWSVAVGGVLVAATWDARTRRIPNVLTLPLLAVGLIFAAVTGGRDGVVSAVLGCLLLGVPYALLFVFAGGGAGDSKMMGTIGAWVGIAGAVPVLVAVSLSGGALAIGYAVIRGRVGALAANLRTIAWGAALIGFWRVRVADAQQVFPEQQQMLRMPYGVAIFAGTLLAAGWVFLWH